MILLQQLGAAGTQNVGMDAAFFEVGAQPLRPALRWSRVFTGARIATVPASVSSYPAKARIAFSSSRVKPARSARMPDGFHGFLNERNDQVGATVPLLPLPERLEKQVALRHSRHGIVNAESGKNFPISLPVRPVEVSARTSQILSSTLNSKEGIAAMVEAPGGI